MKLASTLALALILFTNSSYARGGNKDKKQKHRGQLKELNLTEEQLTKIKEYRKSNRNKMKPLREEIKQTRDKIKESFLADSSTSELTSLHNKMKDLRSQMAQIKFSKMVMLKEILNKEQRAKFMSLEKRKRSRAKR